MTIFKLLHASQHALTGKHQRLARVKEPGLVSGALVVDVQVGSTWIRHEVWCVGRGDDETLALVRGATRLQVLVPDRSFQGTFAAWRADHGAVGIGL